MPRLALVSYGCAKNLVDSEVMLGYLAKAGYQFVSQPGSADIVIVNTCGFIRPAKEEAREAIQGLVRLKRKHAKKKIFVVGCYVERYRAELEMLYPEVDGWLGVREYGQIARIISGEFPARPARSFLYTHDSPRAITTPKGWAYIKISEGCSHQCSFCSIPMIKGAYRSRSMRSIIQEARALAEQDVKEINLISQDTTYFGRDQWQREGLARLLGNLLQVRRLEWIRFLYGYPEEITDALLEVMQEEKICRYLDIPFQHSHGQLLKKMKRGMDGRRALKLIEKIRKRLPGVALRTSLIVGFPGENREEFSDLKNFVRAARFDHLGVFSYSPEDGTAAYELGDSVPDKEKEKRRKEIMEVQAEISRQINSGYLRRIIDVLIAGPQEPDGQRLASRGRFQAPEVDGIVSVDVPRPNPSLSGTIRKVEIRAADVYDLRGTLVA
jgi:ribosomal protein S12 methylthiotransferase